MYAQHRCIKLPVFHIRPCVQYMDWTLDQILGFQEPSLNLRDQLKSIQCNVALPAIKYISKSFMVP